MFYIDKNTELLIDLALAEDIGIGDITSNSTVPVEEMATGTVMSKDSGIIAGLEITKTVFRKVDSEIKFISLIADGERIDTGDEIAKVNGSARSILTAERTVLNFLQRLSGIATLANKFVEAVEDYSANITDTRKTTPGWRALEKYAVRVGGGANHRFGLYDAVLIKDNHIAIAGSITNAVKSARQVIPHTTKVEVETETMEQVKEALNNHVDIIMLDNMACEEMSEAVKLINHRAIVEASGGITLDTVEQVAATGVDLISVGALTHSAMPLDISMEID